MEGWKKYVAMEDQAIVAQGISRSTRRKLRDHKEGEAVPGPEYRKGPGRMNGRGRQKAGSALR